MVAMSPSIFVIFTTFFTTIIIMSENKEKYEVEMEWEGVAL